MSLHSPNGLRVNGTTISPQVPDPEVTPAKAKRRNLTAKQKLKHLSDIDQLGHGEIGAYCRRNGIYSSNLSNWRTLREQGLLSSDGSPPRGPAPKSDDAKKIEKLERELAKARTQLVHADMIIAAQKKLCDIYRLGNQEEPK
jgi:transposase-like protein